MLELAAVHRWVLTGLTVIVVSGVALLDRGHRDIFWFVDFLDEDGSRDSVADQRIHDDPDRDGCWRTTPDDAFAAVGHVFAGSRHRAWRLWFTIALAGVALVNLT